jgi:hypothetical protein
VSTRWIVDWLVFAHEEGGDVSCESADNLVLGIDVPPCPVVGQHCLSMLAYYSLGVNTRPTVCDMAVAVAETLLALSVRVRR